MIIGYLDSSPKNISSEIQRQIISDYALTQRVKIEAFYSCDNIKQFARSFLNNDITVVFANIVCLGYSLAQVKENLQLLKSQNISIYIAQECFCCTAEDNTLLTSLELAVKILNILTSTTTKRALDRKKSQGYKLGRSGHKNKKYIWSGKENEIKQKLLSGITRKQVALDTGMSIYSLYNYINQTPELKRILRKKPNER